jgi:hypothetical protein
MVRLLSVIATLTALTAISACDTHSSREPAMQPKPTEQQTRTPQVPAQPAPPQR